MRRIKPSYVLTFLSLAFLLTAPISSGWDWDFEVVSAGYYFKDTSIDIDSTGSPHIAGYYNCDEFHTPAYFYKEDGSWYYGWEGFDPGTEESDTDSISIALDSNDNAHFTYSIQSIYYGWARTKYAYFDGDMSIETIDEYVMGCTSLSLDPYGYPHISYAPAQVLTYVHWNGTDWIYDVLETGGDVGSNDIVIDSNGKPHISLYGYNFDLGYANRDGSDWYITVIDSVGSVGAGNSIALDSFDYPHISYVDSTNDIIKYAYWDGDDWCITVVDDSDVWAFRTTCICIDSEGRAHIAYRAYTDPDYGYVKYAYWDGSNWEIDILEEGIDYNPMGPSIALDSSGKPHIAYSRLGESLIYARAFENTPPSSFNLSQPPDGAEVPEPVTLDWDDSTDDDGDTITYDVWYATDPSFDPHDEVTELSDSTYTFPEGVLTQGETYYWKVRAWDGYDETWSGPDPYWSFTVEEEITDISVTRFSAESARTGIELTWECAEPGVGFNLYRSEEATGARTKLREILNAELITGESPYAYLDAEVSDGVTYAYWLEALNVGGASETFGPVRCTAGTFVPSSYALYQSRPNPARGTAVIAFDLPEDADVTLTVYGLSGRKVTTPVNEKLPAGAYERPVSGLAPGVYVYRLLAGEFSGVKKMVVQ